MYTTLRDIVISNSEGDIHYNEINLGATANRKEHRQHLPCRKSVSITWRLVKVRAYLDPCYRSSQKFLHNQPDVSAIAENIMQRATELTNTAYVLVQG